MVSDANGNPTNPNTKIHFFLIDGPISGYPDNPGSFFIAGNNGDPQENGLNFSALGGRFLTKGVRPFQRLVLNGGQYRTIQAVSGEDSLTIQSSKPFGPDSRAAIPYVIGHAENAAILSPSFTDLSGVASTILTYPVTRVGQTAILMACTDDYVYCGMLNTCDVNGANCKSVYLGVTNGSDRTLTVSADSLGPNRTTNVQMCLRDVNFTPLPATEIRYDIGSTGPAKVTVNNVEGNKGKILTGEEGCATVKIASSGQIPGGLPIELNFTSDFVAAPIKVTIKSPGAGKMDGLFSCEFAFDNGTGTCKGTLRLTDDEGSPMSGVLIALGPTKPPFPFALTFDPAEGVFGKTNEQGQIQVTINLDGPGDYTFPFQTAAGGTAKYTFDVTIVAPGTLAITPPATATATIGQPYSGVFLANGGVPPYTWSLLSGSLPPGLRLGSDGSISGSATVEGTFSFVVQAKDSKGQTGFAAFTITAAKSGGGTPLEVTLEPATATSGTQGVAYNALFGATGGTAPYTFAIPVGRLPSGLNLNPNGLISGTPTATGAFTFAVVATDDQGVTGTKNFTIVISSPQANAPTISTTSPLPPAAVSTLYATTLAATGGTPPYKWSIDAPNLLAGIGLTLDPNTGILAGTPSATSTGTYTAVIRVTDANNAFAVGTFTLAVGGGGGGVPAAKLLLLTSSPTLDSSGKNPVTLTAIATDANSNALKDVVVTFSLKNSSTGLIQVVSATTDAGGTATATLNTGGDPANRTIAVGATAGTVSSPTVDIQVAGTKLTISGPATAVLGSQVPLTLSLVDSAGTPISSRALTVTSAPTNTLSNVAPTTDIGGQANVTLTANSTAACAPPAATPVCIVVTATGAGATGSLQITVATEGFVFTVPNQTPTPPAIYPPDVCLNSANCTAPRVTPPQTLTVRLTAAGVGLNGCTVTFTTTRGALSSSTATTAGVAPNDGTATVTVSSTNAGPAVITAQANPIACGGTSASLQTQVQVNFVATTPTQLTLQAVPATIGVNVPPSTANRSTITATVRDAAFNLVKGVTVNFTLTDVTNGSINPASAVTDQLGQASTVYTASASASQLNNVKVAAAVVGFPAPPLTCNPVNCEVTLTVAQQSLFVVLGTGNLIAEPTTTTFAQPWNVRVTDVNGNTVQNATVTLGVVPVAKANGTAYAKGFYTKPVPATTPPWVQVITGNCYNEDVNQNGILDPGEDTNNNSLLDPGNVASAPATVTTDSNGQAFFDVVYAQQFANWVTVDLTAFTTVAGSQGSSLARYTLPILASKLANAAASPPGNPSPFGIDGTGQPSCSSAN